MKKLYIISAIMLSLIMTSCGNVLEKSDKLVVYSSFYAMNDFVKTIGGEDIVFHSIVPTGSEPHDFEPTAKDMAKINDADVFVYSGFGIDDWAEDIAETLPDTVTVVCASEGLEKKENDPHIWLSPYCAQKQLETIYKAFSTADSENSQKYLNRLMEYCAQIDAAEEDYKNAGLEGKKIFVTHGAYGYLCEEFGMEQIALEGISGDSDPSPAQMAEIVNQIKSEGAKCIFYDPLEGDKMAKAVAEEAGAEAFPLYTFEGDAEHRDYVTIMKLNLEQLKKGL